MSDDQLTNEATAHFLDNEPELFMGCSQGELFAIAGISFALVATSFFLICLLFTTKILLLIGIPFACSLIFTLPLVWFFARILVKKKRGMPNGYFSLKIKLFVDWLRNLMGIKTKLNSFKGTWSKSRRE